MIRAASGLGGAALVLALVFPLVPALSACESASDARADVGSDAQMQLEAAAFVRGAMPGDGDGPLVSTVALPTNKVRLGGIDHTLAGAMAEGATAAAIGLSGDVGYWIVVAGAPDVQSPREPTFKATASFARSLAPGAHSLVVRAVDARGHMGPAAVEAIDAVAPSAATGALVVTLSWDTEADLDLHVVQPDGVEIYKGNINAYAPPGPGQAADPTAFQRGAMLDVDSNAACVIDGQRAEHVTWKDAPPSGHYLVRVDTFSLCAEVDARWSVDVALAGASIAHVSGTSLQGDTRFAHDRGAGVLAVEFVLP